MDNLAPLPAFLDARYQRWRRSSYPSNQRLYGQLASEGQKPRTLVISCCDSRVDPCAIFCAQPGELFTLRNVANLVPAPTAGESSSASAVEYAVGVLQVRHILVLGHASCGGVQAYYRSQQDAEPEAQQSTTGIGRWLQHLQPAYQRLLENPPEADPLRALEQYSVLVSLANLSKFDCVRQAMAGHALSLHAGWFDIGAGQLHIYDSGNQRFTRL